LIRDFDTCTNMGSTQSRTSEHIQNRQTSALERIAIALELQNSRPAQQQQHFVLSPAPIPPPLAATSNLAAFAAISQQQ
jgi:hypothetical protein